MFMYVLLMHYSVILNIANALEAQKACDLYNLFNSQYGNIWQGQIGMLLPPSSLISLVEEVLIVGQRLF